MMNKENYKKKKKKSDGLVDHMKVVLTIYDSLRKSRALGKKRWKKVGSLFIKRIFKRIYRTYFFSRLSETATN